MADIDWIGHQINLPPQQLKSRRAQIVHLNETAYEHLRRIKTDREFVFPWPFDLTHFHATLHRLQYDAGLPRKFHFGLHELRSTLATVLWEQSPSAAQWALGHASPIITRDYYVRGDKMIARALDGIPQPDAFKAERKDGQK